MTKTRNVEAGQLSHQLLPPRADGRRRGRRRRKLRQVGEQRGQLCSDACRVGRLQALVELLPGQASVREVLLQLAGGLLTLSVADAYLRRLRLLAHEPFLEMLDAVHVASQSHHANGVSTITPPVRR